MEIVAGALFLGLFVGLVVLLRRRSHLVGGTPHDDPVLPPGVPVGRRPPADDGDG